LRTIKRGELYWLDEAKVLGSSRAGLLPPSEGDAANADQETTRASVKHPILIVSSDAFNATVNPGSYEYVTGVIAATLDEAKRARFSRQGWNVILEATDVREDDLSKSGRARVIRCSQIYTFEFTMLGTRIGVVNPRAMPRIDRAFLAVLSS
jgi:mRNA-degrading endonuclease toxin of MazEF toxin-antitoxin module